MSLSKVTPGKNAPQSFNVIIEIPMNADPIKYEVDKASGAMFVDRFMSTAMHYPCNYGYVPQTLSDVAHGCSLGRWERSAITCGVIDGPTAAARSWFSSARPATTEGTDDE